VTIITLVDQQQTKSIVIRFSFFVMNVYVNDFFPSNKTGTRSTSTDGEYLLSSMLKTNHQIATIVFPVYEWSTASTPSTRAQKWSSWHETRPIERNSFSPVYQNIINLRMHVNDLIEHIYASCSKIRALTGILLNDDVNDELGSYFQSQCTIYH
jgi:hypothetical protein